jgi:hypothetical protein
MLIVALVLAVIGLAALVTAVVTSNELVAWVCIGASALGVILLVADAIRERKHRRIEALAAAGVGTAAAGTAKAARKVARTIDAPTAVLADESEFEGAELGEVDLEEFDDYVPEVEVPEVEVPEVAVPDVEAPEAELPDVAVPEDQVPDATAPEFRASEVVVEDHPEEIVHDEPEYDTFSDDETEFPPPAEEAAMHLVVESPDETGDTVVQDEVVLHDHAVDSTTDTTVVVYSSDSADSTVVYLSEDPSEETDATRVVVNDEGR